MLQKIHFLFLFLLCCCTINASAQSQKKIDSLKVELTTTTSETERGKLFYNIGNAYSKQKANDSALLYVKKALAIAKNNKEEERIQKCNYLLGAIFILQEKYTEAEPYVNAASAYFQQAKDADGVSNFMSLQIQKGLIHYMQYNDYATAEKDYQVNLDREKAGKMVDNHMLYLTYNNQYLNLLHQQKYGAALNLINDYIQFSQKNYPRELGTAYQYLGGLYRITKEPKRSIAAYQKGIYYLEKEGKIQEANFSKQSITVSFMNIKQYDSAKYYANDLLQYYEKNKNPEGISNIKNILSAVAFAEKDYDLAEKYITEAINVIPDDNEFNLYNKSFLGTVQLTRLLNDSIALKTDISKRKKLEEVAARLASNFEKISKSGLEKTSPDLVIHNYWTLSQANELLGNYEQAYKYYQSGYKLRDSLYGISKMKTFSDAQSQIDIETEKAKIKFEEATKRLQLQKEIELKALKLEYEKKQAAAKSEEERKRLLLEEELKRKEISIRYEQQQQALSLKFEQEKAIAKIEEEKKDAVAAAELKRTKNIRNLSALGALLAMLLVGITTWSYFQKKKDNKKIAEEKQKTEELLLNILPQEVADELKSEGKTTAKYYENAAVLFTDFVNFTANSERLGVQELLNELNIYFTAFDEIVQKYGLEKIKTIGDAYLAVSGLPNPNSNYAENAVQAALEILDFVEKRKINNPNALDIRIGLHTGPVIAGVVGVKKFAYDIWGDTVNTAARMEQSSEPGKINISAATYQLVKNGFRFQHRGNIHAKGKGAMDMFFVEEQG